MLDYDELEEIIDTITEKIILANRTGTLDALLKQWGFTNLLNSDYTYETDPKGKIVVIGGTEVKENVLLGIAKSFGLDKSRFEFCLDYDRAKTYNYEKMRYNPNYRVVMFGPVPHSSTGKNNSGSVISEMQNNEGYPRVLVLNGSNSVKISKTNFKEGLQKLIEEKYI